MTIAGHDPEPWRLLADATVIGIERDGDVVAVTVQARALRVRLLLAGCDGIRYQPHDEPAIYEIDAIATSEPDIRSARYERGSIVVDGGAGTLRLIYANLAIEVGGERIEPEDLAFRLR